MQFTQIIPEKIVLSDFTYKLIKTGVFIFLLLYTLYIVYEKDVFSLEMVEEVFFLAQNQLFVLILVLFLLPLNWGLEALKWQIMVNKSGIISYRSAYKGVLTGVSMGFASPHGLGDYFGRILQLPIKHRERLIGSVFLTRISQFSITLLFGGISLIYYIDELFALGPLVKYNILFFTLSSIVGLLFIVLFYQRLIILLKSIPFFWKYFGKLSEYSEKEVVKVFFLSLCRYIVFCLQFILLLYAFGVSSDWTLLFLGVNLVFLAKSVIPTLFELGVREYAAVYFFSSFNINSENVLMASLLLWIINLFLPAIVGMFMVFKLKLKLR